MGIQIKSMRFFPSYGAKREFLGAGIWLLGSRTKWKFECRLRRCVTINYKPLLEMTLKITPFELPGRVFSPTSFVHRWELQLILKKDNKFTSLLPILLEKAENFGNHSHSSMRLRNTESLVFSNFDSHHRAFTVFFFMIYLLVYSNVECSF